MTARSPEDVMALVPVVLGFVPEESLVILTLGAPRGRSFHGRVDLPRGRADVDEAIKVLLAPVLRHRVRAVVLIGYSADWRLAERVTRRVATAMSRHVEVIGQLAADGARCWVLPCSPEDPGIVYDVRAHRFAAEAVVRGLVTHGSRGELAMSLLGDPARVRAVEVALARLAPDAGDPVAEAAWAVSLVRHCVGRARGPEPAELARLLRGLRRTQTRDAVLSMLRPRDARREVEFWSGVVRETPTSWLAAPACVLGFAAWLSGHGALAWCAVDRCREADPDYPLARVLAEVLNAAMPPEDWAQVWPSTGPADAGDPAG